MAMELNSCVVAHVGHRRYSEDENKHAERGHRTELLTEVFSETWHPTPGPFPTR